MHVWWWSAAASREITKSSSSHRHGRSSATQLYLDVLQHGRPQYKRACNTKCCPSEAICLGAQAPKPATIRGSHLLLRVIGLDRCGSCILFVTCCGEEAARLVCWCFGSCAIMTVTRPSVTARSRCFAKLAWAASRVLGLRRLFAGVAQKGVMFSCDTSPNHPYSFRYRCQNDPKRSKMPVRTGSLSFFNASLSTSSASQSSRALLALAWLRAVSCLQSKMGQTPHDRQNSKAGWD